MGHRETPESRLTHSCLLLIRASDVRWATLKHCTRAFTVHANKTYRWCQMCLMDWKVGILM